MTMLVRRVWPSRPTFEASFGNFDQIRREMLRLLDTSVGDATPDPGAGVFPPMNITQDDDSFYLRAEIPGIKPAELSISALRNRISISGKREIPREHERVSYHRKERPEGAFNRAVTLPAEVDPERVDARYSDGILTLTLPKAEQAKPRQITVKS
jgi:HSP20 family protein